MSDIKRRIILAGFFSCLAFVSALALGVTGAGPHGSASIFDQSANP